MSKDPAFLMYPKDFIEGTFFMDYEQKGQYITLLCLQHQQGPLTKKQLNMVTTDEAVLEKFTKTEDGKYLNKRLHEETEKRKEGLPKKQIAGMLGGLLAKQNLSKTEKDMIHKNFKMDDFTGFRSKQMLKKCLSKWLTICLTTRVEDANININNNNIKTTTTDSAREIDRIVDNFSGDMEELTAQELEQFEKWCNLLAIKNNQKTLSLGEKQQQLGLLMMFKAEGRDEFTYALNQAITNKAPSIPYMKKCRGSAKLLNMAEEEKSEKAELWSYLKEKIQQSNAGTSYVKKALEELGQDYFGKIKSWVITCCPAGGAQHFEQIVNSLKINA